MANTVVYGIYTTRDQVAEAVGRMKAGGYRNADISALFPDNAGSKDFAFEKDTKAPEGATMGGLSGGALGGALGWLVGIGALAIPGLGIFIAAGPIVAAIAGVGIGATVGGVAGALVGMGIPEYEAKRFEGHVKGGAILLSVHCDDAGWATKAIALLRDTGAEDISSTGETKGDFGNSDKPLASRHIA